MEDLEKLKNSEILSLTHPLSLLSNVWFHISLFWCRRGFEGQRSLKNSSFGFSEDHFFSMAHDEATKNHQGRVRNCDQLVANASENLVLATRSSRLVASRRLNFSVVSTQGIKSTNFAFDFIKKLNPCLVESAHCNRNLAAAMFSAN